MTRGIDEPVVVGGDLNAHPEDAVTATIAAVLPDVWTRVGGSDGRDHGQGQEGRSLVRADRSDRLPLRGFGLPAARVWTSGGTVSDHLMVIADLEVGV